MSARETTRKEVYTFWTKLYTAIVMSIQRKIQCYVRYRYRFWVGHSKSTTKQPVEPKLQCMTLYSGTCKNINCPIVGHGSVSFTSITFVLIYKPCLVIRVIITGMLHVGSSRVVRILLPWLVCTDSSPCSITPTFMTPTHTADKSSKHTSCLACLALGCQFCHCNQSFP